MAEERRTPSTGLHHGLQEHGFAVPYLHNGQMHDYQPDFIIQLEARNEQYLILETKGYDPIEDLKKAAAERWCSAVNAHGGYGRWRYKMIRRTDEIRGVLDKSLLELGEIRIMIKIRIRNGGMARGQSSR